MVTFVWIAASVSRDQKIGTATPATITNPKITTVMMVMMGTLPAHGRHSLVTPLRKCSYSQRPHNGLVMERCGWGKGVGLSLGLRGSSGSLRVVASGLATWRMGVEVNGMVIPYSPDVPLRTLRPENQVSGGQISGRQISGGIIIPLASSALELVPALEYLRAQRLMTVPSWFDREGRDAGALARRL